MSPSSKKRVSSAHPRIGILGGGQLGKMLTQAAMNFDLHLSIMDSSTDVPCEPYCHNFVVGDFADFDAVYGFGHQVELLTIEIENVNVPALRKLQLSEGDRAFGVKIVERALEGPARRIAQNAGVDGAVVVQRILDGKGAFGFNAQTETYEDLEAAGVIDPTKVSRTALQNAASVASLLLTTEAMVAEKPRKKPAGVGAGGMGGGMEDMDY